VNAVSCFIANRGSWKTALCVRDEWHRHWPRANTAAGPMSWQATKPTTTMVWCGEVGGDAMRHHQRKSVGCCSIFIGIAAYDWGQELLVGCRVRLSDERKRVIDGTSAANIGSLKIFMLKFGGPKNARHDPLSVRVPQQLESLLDRDLQKFRTVFINESHRFRTEDTLSYEMLAQICRGKRVVSVSATH
jgi:hypothetical protein